MRKVPLIDRDGEVRIQRREFIHGAVAALAASGFGREALAEDRVIQPDLEKLDLERTDLVSLHDIRARDSGRIVGPKAAKLGELKYHYPAAVADGVTIPFGVFNQILQQPMADGRWMNFIEEQGVPDYRI